MAKSLTPSRPSPERAEAALAALRAGPFDSEALEPAEWLALAGDLAEAQDVEALARLQAGAAHKGLRKGLRRIYHKLRSAGVDVPEAPRTSEGLSLVSPRRHSRPGGPCSVGSLCGSFLVTSIWAPHGALPLFFQARFEGRELEAGFSSPTHSALRSFQRNADREGYREVPVPYQDYLVGLALQRKRATGEALDPSVISALTVIGHLEVGPVHPLSAALADRGVELPTSVATSGDLFDRPFFAALRYRRKYLELFADKLAEIQSSQLVLSQFQEQERVQETIRAVVSEVVEDAGIDAVALSLRHTGMLALLEGGLDREAATLAKIAEIVEDGVELGDIPLFTRPFELLLIPQDSAAVGGESKIIL